MRALIALPVLVLSVLALPAHAEPAGSVSQLALAHQLFAQGAANRDALAQIAAARLAAGVTVQMVARAPELSGTAGKGPDAADAPRDAASLLAAATAAAEADETLAILLGSAIATAEVLPKGVVRASVATLNPGQSHRYRIAADGAVPVEIGVIGDGDSVLALSVETEAGPACLAPLVPACAVTLPDSGFLAVRVVNSGPGVNSYWLISN